jgi:hypothetical protein
MMMGRRARHHPARIGVDGCPGTSTLTARRSPARLTRPHFSAAGSSFTTRVITQPDLDIAEDRFVTTTGSYSATAPLSASAAWVMQVATFRAAT